MPRPDEILASEHQWLRRLARRMARSPGSADDLVQETCLTVLDKPAPSGEMRPWLRAIMRNLAWGEVRGGVRRGQREDLYQRMAPPAVEPDPLLSYGIDRARLHGCVERLPEPFRSTVVQRFVDGLSCAEIAEAEGVPAGTVRWRQSRALELLRAELERPAPRRRRHGLWLPVLGLERAIAVGRRLVRTPAGTGAALALAVALLLLAIVSRDDGGIADGAPSAGRKSLAPGAILLAGSAGSRPESAVSPLEMSGAAAPRGAVDEEPATAGRGASWPEGSALLDPAELEALREAYERALYDCRVERDVLRCIRRAVDPRRADAATCVVLERSLVALARARRGEVASGRPLPVAFLEAAGLADRALVAALGCVIAPDLEDAPDDRRQLGGAARPEPSCTADEGSEGQPCATCTDGAEPGGTACAPVDCDTTTGPDGHTCTTCTDASGLTLTECDEGEAIACDVEVREYGVVCASCPAGSGAAPECLVAECLVRDGCIECTDGRGRTARDCTIDTEALPTALAAWGGGDVLRMTSAWWGDPRGAGSAVHYAGTSTCSAEFCLDCRFADGSGSGICPYDGDLEDDLMRGRPAGLPAPGGCETARPGGGVECTSCTRADLSASTLCRFPPAVRCDQSGDGCVTCRLAGGGTASSCAPGGT